MTGDKIVDRALSTLKRGGVILYPTDTIWGLGCDATDERAVEKIYAIKRRPKDKSMIVLVEDAQRLMRLVPEIPDRAWSLMRSAQKPLTLVYEKAENVASNLLAADGSLGIRLTHDKWLGKLIHRFNRPLVSTSANRSGLPSPICFGEVDTGILEAVDYTVPLQREKKARFAGSVVIKLGRDGRFKILRK